MTIPATGTVTMRGTTARHGISEEFGANTGADKLSEYYRGGPNVPTASKASIATAGAQKYSNYRGAAKITQFSPAGMPPGAPHSMETFVPTYTPYTGTGSSMQPSYQFNLVRTAFQGGQQVVLTGPQAGTGARPGRLVLNAPLTVPASMGTYWIDTRGGNFGIPPPWDGTVHIDQIGMTQLTLAPNAVWNGWGSNTVLAFDVSALSYSSTSGAHRGTHDAVGGTLHMSFVFTTTAGTHAEHQVAIPLQSLLSPVNDYRPVKYHGDIQFPATDPLAAAIKAVSHGATSVISLDIWYWLT